MSRMVTYLQAADSILLDDDRHLALVKRGGHILDHVRVAEALVDHFVYDNEYNTTDEEWQKYFFQFNYAAALQRGR